MSPGHALILLRHGQSAGNADSIFTGLLDVPLTRLGRQQTISAATMLNRIGIQPDALICSPLLRARQTAILLRQHLDEVPSELIADWQLAERNYGVLTGHRKNEVARRYGHDQFVSWRRSVDEAPPPMNRATAARLFHGRADGITEAHLGRTESLRHVIRRVAACLHELVEPRLEQNRIVAVIAHGNSLRAMCAVLDELTDAEVSALNLPTGEPLLYHLDDCGRPLHRGGTYLDPAAAAAAATLIAHEGGT